MSKRFTLKIEETYDGDCYVNIPQDLMDECGWKAGDVLEYEEETDGSVILIKSEE
jgi:bifunctional DNA-binding transcriptional regulator/antitoxin component of YhaV-PrlF toxin-antitoxin module|tara:strand:+ start:947 stop:1111 length:165 start_codon:yes stop_codon:yes gene_type:complete